jgi:transposase
MKKNKLSQKQYANLQKRYRNIMTRGESELPAIPEKPNGKRWKMAKSDAHNLWERLTNNEAGVFLFAKQSEVSFTNNRAERDLRMAKAKQKVSVFLEVKLMHKHTVEFQTIFKQW